MAPTLPLLLALALLPAAARGASFLVNTSDVVQPQVNKNIMGCHHDYGFAQAPRGFYAEMVYGTSFDSGTQGVSGWHPFWINSTAEAPKMTSYTSFSARPTLGLSLDHDFATLGMANRGIGNAGLYLEAGKPYTVEFWAWCGAGAGNEACTQQGGKPRRRRLRTAQRPPPQRNPTHPSLSPGFDRGPCRLTPRSRRSTSSSSTSRTATRPLRARTSSSSARARPGAPTGFTSTPR